MMADGEKAEELHDHVSKQNSIDHDALKTTEVVAGNTAFNEALMKEPPNPRSMRSLILYAVCLVGFFCSTMNGYDGALYNSISASDVFLDYFGGSNKGIWAGIVSSMYQIGGVAALPFAGPANDTLGRRFGMGVGSLLVITGTIVSAVVKGGNIGQFMGGRFLLGFGVSITSTAGPIYVTEVAHPAYRGVLTAFFNTLWFTGSILASGVARGAANLDGNAPWMVPLWLQLLFSGVILVCCPFLPESPRWLYVNNKLDKAKAVLTRYHGEGNPESEWVKLQLAEYEEFLDSEGADKRWWDYRALFRDSVSRYRVMCACAVAVFGQWAGNGVLSYFMPAVLDTLGITDSIQKLNIILINSCQQFFFALIGASLVERVGRRPLLLFANIGCCITWMCITICSSENTNSSSDSPAGRATLAFIFIFGAIFSIGFTPLQALLPVEVLSFEMRGKGMAFQTLVMNAAMLLNQFAWPVSIKRIEWKTYIILCIWCAVQAVVIYFIIPETKYRTLEELDEIFKADNPVKASLKKKELAVASDGEVVKVGDA